MQNVGSFERLVTNNKIDLNNTSKQLIYVCPGGVGTQGIGFGLRDPNTIIPPETEFSFGFNEEANDIMPRNRVGNIDKNGILGPGKFLIIRPFGVTLIGKPGQELGIKIYTPLSGNSNVDIYGYLI